MAALDPQYMDAIKKSEGLDVVPVLSAANNRNLSLADTKLFGQVNLPNSDCSANGADIGFGKFSISMPSFRNHVSSVGFMGSKKEVFWVDTRSIIASMANERALGDWP